MRLPILLLLLFAPRAFCEQAGVTAFTTILKTATGIIPGDGVVKFVLGSFALFGDTFVGVDTMFDTPDTKVQTAVGDLSAKIDQYQKDILKQVSSINSAMVKLFFTQEVVFPVNKLFIKMQDVLKYPKKAEYRDILLNNKYIENDPYELAMSFNQWLRENTTSILDLACKTDDMYAGSTEDLQAMQQYIQNILDKLLLVHAFQYGLRGQNRKLVNQLKTNATLAKLNETEMKDWYMKQFLANYPDTMQLKCAEISNYVTKYIANYKNTNPYWSRPCLSNIVDLVMKNGPDVSPDTHAQRVFTHISKIHTLDKLFVIVTKDADCGILKEYKHVFRKNLNNETFYVIRTPSAYVRSKVTSEMTGILDKTSKNTCESERCLDVLPSATVKHTIVLYSMDERPSETYFRRTSTADAVFVKQLPSWQLFIGYLESCWSRTRSAHVIYVTV